MQCKIKLCKYYKMGELRNFSIRNFILNITQNPEARKETNDKFDIKIMQKPS